MWDSAAEQGRIMKGVGGFYELQTESGGTLTCRPRGLFRKQGLCPLPGDIAGFRRLPEGGGVLETLMPRRNVFRRPPCANIDILLMIASESIPRTDPYLIDRMAAAAAHKGVETVLLINKCDLSNESRLRGIYEAAGFSVLSVSALTGEGLDALPALLRGKLTVLSGNSGVGKSAIMGYLNPNGIHQTGEVSEKLGRGRHTTRHVELFSLPDGILIADTPGFAALDTTDGIPPKDLASCFPDIRSYLSECRFTGCLHENDLGCAVRAAAEQGDLHPSRYQNYLRMLHTARSGGERRE